MNKTRIKVRIEERNKRGFAVVDGFHYPTVGLAITPDVTYLGYNVTHVPTGLKLNTIPQTKARCESFIREERSAGRNWGAMVTVQNATTMVKETEGLRERILEDLCRRNSSSTRRRRKKALV